MSAHDYHEGHPGYSPAQVLHDGCGECAYRSQEPSQAIARFDRAHFRAAWKRAAEWNRSGLADIAEAEVPVFRVLWACQLQFERLGLPIGDPPSALDLAPVALHPIT